MSPDPTSITVCIIVSHLKPLAWVTICFLEKAVAAAEPSRIISFQITPLDGGAGSDCQENNRSHKL